MVLLARERLQRGRPPWGEQFPFECGVSPDEFLFWATTATDYRGRVRDSQLFHKLTYVDQVLTEFCSSCDPAFRRAATARGACIQARLLDSRP